MSNKLPSISVLIPTLNVGAVLEGCLASIDAQIYPKNKIEIIIADGGSTDRTIEIAKRYKAKIYKNSLKTGESGKAEALRHAKGEIVALIDSDNILPKKNWLKRMVEPFADKQILGSEPWEFTYRKKDSLISRYCALLGANDPYCYFVGNYDRRSVLSGKWTEINMEEEDRGNFLKVKIEGKILPTIGANGTMWRREVLKRAVGKDNYLFDTDIVYKLSRKKPFYFSKVKIGIIHLYCKQVSDFIRKQKRRIRDFYYLETKNEREETYQKQLSKQIYFIFSCVFLFPLFFQTIRGFLKKPDFAWLFHTPACLLTLWIYASELLLLKLNIRKVKIDRKNWKQ